MARDPGDLPPDLTCAIWNWREYPTSSAALRRAHPSSTPARRGRRGRCPREWPCTAGNRPRYGRDQRAPTADRLATGARGLAGHSRVQPHLSCAIWNGQEWQDVSGSGPENRSVTGACGAQHAGAFPAKTAVHRRELPGIWPIRRARRPVRLRRGRASRLDVAISCQIHLAQS
jgi:hypothetical protein